jgi:DNA polymerase III subunit delta
MSKAGTSDAARAGLEQALKRGEFSPLYLFHGDEDLLIDETIGTIISRALDESARSFNLDILGGPETDARTVLALVSAYPMMSERRVVVIRDCEKLPGRDQMVPYFEQPLASTILVLVTRKPDNRQKYFKALQPSAVVVEFRQLYENEIPGWIGKRITAQGKTASQEVCQLLGTYLGRSLREIQQEIDKLFLFVGERQTITVDDVTAVVGNSRNANIFELQRAIGTGDLGRSLSVVSQMIASGESAVGMIVMLSRYIQKLWLLQEHMKSISNEFQLASALGVSPAFIREYIGAARRYSSAHLESCFSALVEADSALKSGGPDPALIMTILIYRCCSPERMPATA